MESRTEIRRTTKAGEKSAAAGGEKDSIEEVTGDDGDDDGDGDGDDERECEILRQFPGFESFEILSREDSGFSLARTPVRQHVL